MSDDGYPMVIGVLAEEDGGGYIAYAPDLHGCMADGDTPTAAVQDLESAIKEWIDEAVRLGRDVPKPGACAIRAQQERAKLDTLVKAQEQLIVQQDELLREARVEMLRIKEALSTPVERLGTGEESYLGWMSIGVPVRAFNVVPRKKAHPLTN